MVVIYTVILYIFVCFFFFKQKTAYEMRISDWSSDVCSSDLVHGLPFVFLDLLGLLGIPFFFLHLNGQRDMVGITAQDLAQLPSVQKFILVIAQVQGYRGAAIGLFHWRDGKQIGRAHV